MAARDGPLAEPDDRAIIGHALDHPRALGPQVEPEPEPFLGRCSRCNQLVLDAQPRVSVYPNPRGNLRLTVADGELITEAVPISQQQPGDNLHLAHVVTCRPRKGPKP